MTSAGSQLLAASVGSQYTRQVLEATTCCKYRKLLLAGGGGGHYLRQVMEVTTCGKFGGHYLRQVLEATACLYCLFD
ncbi:hypothetical protein J6590_071493 [Homalodisca vitripennis]|nr:hypothetical protein J6590_071493 [Homalodisca vitripennis]